MSSLADLLALPSFARYGNFPQGRRRHKYTTSPWMADMSEHSVPPFGSDLRANAILSVAGSTTLQSFRFIIDPMLDEYMGTDMPACLVPSIAKLREGLKSVLWVLESTLCRVEQDIYAFELILGMYARPSTSTLNRSIATWSRG